ncbi:MAG: hypothetical protein NZZ60_02500 [Bacteroidia bacterium]|nr:hypothetical protein [Bacteroidia bacterium]MCX7652211.1 hypothetical protein [Bacteroidia bacterium]MDW8416473.1 hypothetical protein [Bacteroidia bacterium]
MSWVWLQIALFGGWGGHTSQNDLVAPNEIWHRFYGMGVMGVRFSAKKRLQPTLCVELGRFISQERQRGLFSQTRWNSVGIGVRVRPLRRAFSPFGEGLVFRMNAQCRDANGKTIPGASSSLSVNGIGWGVGFSWQMSPHGEIALLYLRRRPQTPQLEGVPGPARDRIEGIVGQLSLFFISAPSNRSRF